MDEVTLYLGTLAAIGVGGLILIVVILTRGSGGDRGKSQPVRNAPRSSPVPRVQVVLAEGDESLIWVVNGRATRDLALITDPTERQAIATLLKRVQAVQMPILEVTEPSARYPLPPSPQEKLDETQDAERGTQQIDAGYTPDETPVAPPASPPSLTYEDELTRPFLARLRDSLFGVDYDTKPSTRMYSMRPSPPPKKGAAKEPDLMESGFGIPRFEELNALVQQKLAALPDAPHTAIRVGRDGLLEIVVQGRVYEHIDEVPDEAVRHAIQEAVAIWNRR